MFGSIIFISVCVLSTTSLEMPCGYGLETVYLTPPDWKDIATSLDQYTKSTNAKDGKFASLIHLLKTLLAEELEKGSYYVIDDNAARNNEIGRSYIENYTATDTVIDYNRQCQTDENKELKEVVTNIWTGLNKSKVKNTKEVNVQVPSMIPIFRPNSNAKSEMQPTPQKKCIKTSEKCELNANLNFNPNTAGFQIPCQRTSDILDSTYLIPKEKCDKCNLKKIPIDQNIQSSLQKSMPTTSVSCVESNDLIAMLFKPKSITLMQVYGNLLKKITITVLVPLYVSRLTR